MKRFGEFHVSSLMAFVLVLFTLIISSSLAASAYSLETSTISATLQAASQDCSAAILTDARTLSTEKAVAMAQSSEQYQKAIAGNDAVIFNSLMDTWSYDLSCNISLTNVGVVFGLRNSTGFIGWLVITESYDLSSVVSTSLQENPNSTYGSSVPGMHWAGWEFYGNSGGTATIYESEVDYTEPTPSTPPGGCANYHTCDVAVWAGLENSEGASNNILAQTGTNAQIQCNPSCVTTHQAWYEQLTAAPVYCTSFTGIASGDSMHVTVTNEAANGGSNTKYDYLVNDNTQLKACSWTGVTYSSLSDPTLSAHIVEWPNICGPIDCSTLAEFPQNTIYGSMLIGGVTYGVHYAYSNGWYYHVDPMENYCSSNSSTVVNVRTSTVNSNSGWTATWNGSCGT